PQLDCRSGSYPGHDWRAPRRTGVKRQVALARTLRSRRKGHTYRAASTRQYSRSASVVGNREIAARGNTGNVQRCRSGVGPRDALRLTGHTDDRLREAQLRSGKRHRRRAATAVTENERSDVGAPVKRAVYLLVLVRVEERTVVSRVHLTCR